MAMNPHDPEDWQRSSPFAIVFFVGSAFKVFRQILIQGGLPVVALVIAFWDNLGRMNVLLFLAAAVALMVLAGAVIQWACFRFRIGEDRLLIRKGFVKKTRVDLPYERTLGVHVQRSLVDRVIGLVTVTLDTSGSTQAEGRLPSIRTEVANRLRARVAAALPTDAGADAARDASDAADGRLAAPSRRGRVLIKLGPADMVRIGLGSRNFLFVAATIGILADLLQPGNLADPIREAVVAGAGRATSAVFGLGALARAALATMAILAVLTTALVLTVTAAFLRHHAFALWHDGSTFRSRSGLFTQREVVVETPKIQQLSVSQDIVMRWFKRFRLCALPAAANVAQGGGSPGNLDAAGALDIPLLSDQAVEDLHARVFGEEAQNIVALPHSTAFKRVSPYYIRTLTLRLWLIAGLCLGLVSLALLPSGVSPGAWMLIGWIAALPVAAGIAWQVWRRRGYARDDDGIATRSGFIGSKTNAFLMRKAQAATLKQSPFQRRKGLATLQVQLACGSVTVPYIDEGAARQLRDYILYKVETSQRRWH